MKIIRSHKTLFKKIIVVSFIIAAISIATFLTYGMSVLERIEGESRNEAEQYLAGLDKLASVYADSVINDAASAFSGKIKGGSGHSKALAYIGGNLSQGGLDKARIWYQEESGKIYSYDDYHIDVPIPEEFQEFKNCGVNSGPIFYQNALYTLIYRDLERLKGKRNNIAYLILALPKDCIYKILDRDERIVGIELYESAAAGRNIAEPESAFSIPLITSDSIEVGLVNIKKASPSSAYRDIWRWEVTVLGLLPLLSIFIFGYLLVRYFESFSNHSEALCRLLTKGKPGVEIFRRDQQIAEKYMPELAELFSLAEENAADRVNLKKNLERIGMTLEVIEEKWFEGR